MGIKGACLPEGGVPTCPQGEAETVAKELRFFSLIGNVDRKEPCRLYDRSRSYKVLFLALSLLLCIVFCLFLFVCLGNL